MKPTVLLEPFQDLYRRRLWPVAVLLVAAAVATPVVLGEPEEAPVATAAAAAPSSEGLDAASIVSVAGPDGTRRRVLGARKDPFTPTGDQPEPLKLASTKPASGSGSGSSSSAGDTASPFGGGSSGSAPATTGGSPALPTPTFDGPISPTPAVPDPATGEDETPAIFALTVRLDEGESQTLNRLDALPSAEDPLAIYLGVLDGGKTAVLLLDESVVAEGDGSCHPTPEDCQRLYVEKGDTVFLDVAGVDGAEGAQHQIDVLGIRTKAASKATTASASVSGSGRRALRARFARVGRLRYDRRSGVLRKITVDAFRAEQARARAAAR